MSRGDKVNAGGAFLDAVFNGDLKKIRAMVKAGINPNKVVGPFGNMAITIACQMDKVKALKLLLKLGANPNQIILDNNPITHVIKEYTPLMLSDTKECIDVLISKGADVNLSTPTGKTALLQAVNVANSEVVETLLKYGADTTSKIQVRRPKKLVDAFELANIRLRYWRKVLKEDKSKLAKKECSELRKICKLFSKKKS